MSILKSIIKFFLPEPKKKYYIVHIVDDVVGALSPFGIHADNMYYAMQKAEETVREWHEKGSLPKSVHIASVEAYGDYMNGLTGTYFP